ncbi:MAG: hypothetical protein A2137_03870 [Chloroflexi bacterium RBG_16_58_8]|nr:MAG: hypothetical protein A2137_03870 [Chloroflexi bacterium RBG_16_58_8]
MQAYLDKGIKEIIDEFPPVAGVLHRYDIGCVACGLGTCRLKDVVGIHDLDPEAETALMGGIARVVFPGREVALPAIERPARAKSGEAAYSPPMKKLVDEHKLIKRWLALIPGVAQGLDIATESGRQLARQGIDFIRGYADRFHHAKEEAILFKYFDEDLDIIKTMCADHENVRAKVRAMEAALEKGDKQALAENLRAYRELLTEHIKKEDEILYRWMDRNLTVTQVGELFSRFREKESEFGNVPREFEDFVCQLESKYR